MKTIVNFVLDKSGSMEDCRNATISGFNEYVSTLKNKRKKDDNILFSLTLFDTEVIKKHVAVPLSRVRKLTRRSYRPDGMTALYDAVIDTVETASERVDEMKGKVKSLVVIMTDGEENSSTKHDQNCLADLIKQFRKENWTFVFLGANQDSWATTANWGLDARNVANYQSTPRGAAIAFMSLAKDTVSYANSNQLSTRKFFSKKELSEDDS